MLSLSILPVSLSPSLTLSCSPLLLFSLSLSLFCSIIAWLINYKGISESEKRRWHFNLQRKKKPAPTHHTHTHAHKHLHTHIHTPTHHTHSQSYYQQIFFSSAYSSRRFFCHPACISTRKIPLVFTQSSSLHFCKNAHTKSINMPSESICFPGKLYYCNHNLAGISN